MKSKKLKRMAVVIVLMLMICFCETVSFARDMPYIGEIGLFTYDFAPIGYMECNGQSLSISENDVLFNLIGTTYGGDGETNFKLPDLRGLEPYPGTRYCIATNGVYPSEY